MISRKQAEQAMEILQLSPENMNVAAVEGAYRAMARHTHPDAGGSQDAFAAVGDAKATLISWINQGAQASVSTLTSGCEPCGGTGSVKVQRGFRSMRVVCGKCKGTGDMNYDHDITGSDGL